MFAIADPKIHQTVTSSTAAQIKANVLKPVFCKLFSVIIFANTGKSDFSFFLYRQLWTYGMELWSDLALPLIAFKSHKHLFFQRCFHDLSPMKQAV